MSFRFWIIQTALATALLAQQPAPAQNEPPAAPLDVNRATAAELDRVPGIGPNRAAAIIRLRERNGPFRGVDEIRALPRVSEKLFRQLQPYLTVATPQGNPSPSPRDRY